ncbi:MAG: TOMM system kinase/cyclase fusion protein [Myxococcota bacterium]|nr:TOMM system kinase/cyclase fusion protein [Myxococcota bacterium]
MESESTPPLPSTLLADRYEVLAELGSGSSGRVVRARQASTGQPVAIKLLASGERCADTRRADRFRRETGICAALSHTNIVRLIDAGETEEGQLFAVFEYVPGETLAEVLARDGKLEVREAVRLMTQVLDALAAAHVQGIVHRDLKPSNLMLSGTGARRNALVLDFGLGGLHEGRRGRHWQTLTQTREFLGTPLYAAPEQLAGEAATPRSDLYAWGLVFLECLTGRHPFDAQGAAARLFSGGGAVEIPAWLRGHRLGELLQMVTAPEAEQREVPIGSLIEALDEIAGGELPVAPEQGRRPRPLAESGERRHLTVLFCDLVDSAGLAQRLGPEAYRRVVADHHTRSADVVARYGGHVAQYLGDGLLVYFGHPRAHEDDAERAVRAGRDLVREVEAANPDLESRFGVRVAARVAIHSGPVVVGEIGGGNRTETLALGDTPTIASRLQSVAEPGAVVISEATLRLVAGIFVTEDLGTPALKGIAQPIRVHRVLHPSGVASRLDRAPALTRFVGRQQELALLLDRVEQAQEGRGQAVWVSGEAGIGKSRLLHRLREELRETPHTWLECHCSPHTQNSDLRPLVEALEQALRYDDEPSPAQKLDRLERGLAHAGLDPEQNVPLLGPLLSLELPERYPAPGLGPRLQRQRTLEALLSWVLALGEMQPLVLEVEDLHWADPSTLEWLGLLVEQCATARVLVLLTFRPDFEPPWASREHLLPMALPRMRRRDARELAGATLGGSALPDAVVDEIASRSDGIPLFVEELARGVAEAGLDPCRSVSDLEIPETLQDSLMARLDNLGEAKQVAQLGAVVGREFGYALIESVAPMEAGVLREGLGRLVEAELLYQRGLPPQAIYSFKHALVQDAAYESLLESQRRELHGRVADALERRFPEIVAREPEQMARHCREAGRTEQAIGHYQQAGLRTAQRSAQAEAVGHLREALELLGTTAETGGRNQLELQLQVALGSSLYAVKGGADPEVERVYERALELCRDTPESTELVRALLFLSLFYFTSRADLRTSHDLAARALELAERTGETFPQVAAHTRLGITLAYQGSWPRALEHLGPAVALYDPPAHGLLAAGWGQDWGLVARVYCAPALYHLGRPDEARRMALETLELAREGDAYSIAAGHSGCAALYRMLRDRGRARKVAERSRAIGRERGLPLVQAMSCLELGWAIGGAEGIELLQEALARFGAMRTVIYQPQTQLILAEAYADLGRLDEAWDTLDARQASGIDGRLHAEDEQLLRGAIHWRRGAPAEAEHCLHRALEIARAGGARATELRAATELASLLRDRGEADQARALLQPVYAGYTQGFDTRDLQEARAVLDALG